MKLNYLKMGGLLVLSVASLVGTSVDSEQKKLGFIDASFDDFINRVIPEGQARDEFKAYYAQLQQKMNEVDEKKRDATYRYLYDKALKGLAAEHADWHEEIMHYLTDPLLSLDKRFEQVRDVMRFFLTRYGAYAEFQDVKHSIDEKQRILADNSTIGVWSTVKSYVHAGVDKIASWFGFGASEQKIIA